MKKNYKTGKQLMAIAAGFLLLGHSILSFSQESIDDLLDISFDELLKSNITVASSRGSNIFNTPSTVTVIDQSTIAEYNFQTISEAVQTVAGMSVYRTYLKRNLPTSRGIVQEHYANKTLVLINGVASWNSVTGEGNLDRININDVERIEILKGPASVLYGTNAYTGAINIVLKSENTKSSAEGHAGIGSNYSTLGGANLNVRNNDFRFFVSANNLTINGPRQSFTGEKGQTTRYNEYLKAQSFTMQTGYKCHTLLLNTYVGSESYLGVIPAVGSNGTVGGAGNAHDLQSILAAYKFRRDVTEKIQLSMDAYYDYNYRDISRTSSDEVRSAIYGYSTGGKLMGSIQATDFLTIDAGADYHYRISEGYAVYIPWKDSVTAESNMKNKNVTENSFFAQGHLELDKLQLMAGSRYTNHSLFGDNISSRATMVYLLNEKNSFKLMYGESYRAPAIFEQYFVAATVYGNPNLKPETSKSIELAYLTSFDKFFIQALVYHGIYENKIYRSIDSTLLRADGNINTNKKPTYDNGSSFSANGLELEVKYNNPKVVNAFVNYGFIQGTDGDKVEGSDVYNFKYVPEHTISAGLSRSFLKVFNISGVYNYISDMGGPYATLAPQQTIDLNLGIQHTLLNTRLNHIISVKNVTDTDIMFPEYARNNPNQVNPVNSVPYGYPRFISYTVKMQF